MAYPTLVLKNQFGEQSENFIVGGSSQISCNFVVDSANGNGLGIRSLKASPLGVANVYMHTSSTPAAGNPNPAAGYILVKFAEGFAGYNGGTAGFVSPVSGTPILVTAGLSVGTPYVITTVGTTTASQWQALGVPTTTTPAVGVSFVAKTGTAGSGTGAVEVIKTTGSGIDHVEVFGDANLTSAPVAGGQIILACFLSNAVATPSDGTVIGLTFSMVPLAGPLI